MKTPKSGEMIPLLIDSMDLGQAVEGIDVRAEAYERTAAYLESVAKGKSFDYGDFFFIIEEVNDACEAKAIAAHFRHIERELLRQLSEWRKSKS